MPPKSMIQVYYNCIKSPQIQRVKKGWKNTRLDEDDLRIRTHDNLERCEWVCIQNQKLLCNEQLQNWEVWGL